MKRKINTPLNPETLMELPSAIGSGPELRPNPEDHPIPEASFDTTSPYGNSHKTDLHEIIDPN